MADSPQIITARESGDPTDWAIAWQATVDGNPEILTNPDDLVGWMTGWFARAGQSMINNYVDLHTQPRHAPDPEKFASADTPESVVYQAIGAGSMCWENLSGTGVFDDALARRFAQEACLRLEQLGVQTVPAGSESVIPVADHA